MSAVLPHYKSGPANYQVSTLIFGGQLVVPTTLTAGTTDLTVKPSLAASVNVLGVAGKDANVVATQTGAANTYGQPQIDVSVLDDFTSVYYGGVDIPVWYDASTVSTLAIPGALLIAGANGTVVPLGAGTTYSQIIGRVTQPGGVTAAMCNQQIGGIGGATFFLGRARIF